MRGRSRSPGGQLIVLSQAEKTALARYLANGGFLWVDDFWGDAEWRQLEDVMRDVLQMRAWLDDDGRVMVLATHNTDIGDGWEREAYGDWYFETFSTKSYMVGINVLAYAMTH